jgi:hypothetical protein
VKIMKKIIILISALILMMLFAVAPAMAAPATKVSVTASHTLALINPGTGWVTDGGVVQLRDIVYGGTVRLDIATTSANPDYTFTQRREQFGTVTHGRDIPYPGPWPEAKGEWHAKIVWTYSVNGQVQGTFEGEMKLTSIGWILLSNGLAASGPTEGHYVLQGSGIFKGQTLLLDSTSPPTVYTGILLTR